MSKEQRLKQLLSTPTIRLAAIHLTIIMLFSISFSAVLYNISDRQFSRPFTPVPSQGIRPGVPEGFMNRFDNELRSALDERLDQTRQELFIRLIWVNITALILGSVISYYLARWSLKPIEEAMDAQTQFVSDASHELRTPLAVLQTSNEVALRKSKLTPKEARDLAANNVEEVKKLRDLTNTLLDLLKSSSKDLLLKETSLQNVVSEAMSFVVTAAQIKNISIEDKVPKINVYTNQALLARILSVILDNAVKYSPSNTQITITANKSAKKTLIHVADQGVGIRASDLPLIFRRFYQADKSRNTSQSQGYGLGLSIADKISRQIGAKITATSTIGQGSTFTVELPSRLNASN